MTISVIFLHGPAATGKTTYARERDEIPIYFDSWGNTQKRDFYEKIRIFQQEDITSVTVFEVLSLNKPNIKKFIADMEGLDCFVSYIEFTREQANAWREKMGLRSEGED